ncbi:MAG: hypothetical protein P8010_02085 [Desulfosarcinaceae bacterium]
MVSQKTVKRHLCRIIVLVCTLVCGPYISNTLVLAAPVDLTSARQVAEAEVQRHIDLYGAWGDAQTAHIDAGETVWLDGEAVAHLFRVHPAGHVLVAADDRFSPVLL